MNTEEIDYWLRLFSNNNQSFMSKDGKKITLFKVFQELKELHYLLKIKNDYINELEAYKYNLDRDYLRLEKENEELKEENETIQEKFKEWKKDIEKERKFYLCERDCAFRLKESKKYLSYTQQIEKLEQENQSLKKENKILRENAEHNDKVVDKVNWENLKLKKQLDEYKRLGFEHLNDKCNKLENHQKDFIEYLENEKDRLARECSRIYVDSLGKTRLVSEDIYDEVDKILSKYKEVEGNNIESER